MTGAFNDTCTHAAAAAPWEGNRGYGDTYEEGCTENGYAASSRFRASMARAVTSSTLPSAEIVTTRPCAL